MTESLPSAWKDLPESYQLDKYSKMIDVDPSLFLPAEQLEDHYTKSWNLYKEMGSPKTVCAPMVNQSELPFRMFVRKYKTDLCYTPMIHSMVFLCNPKNWIKMFGTAEGDKPLIAQFCGDDPEIVLKAAMKVQDRVNAIDLNLGCPQGIAKKGHYGSFLLPDTRLVQKIVRTLHDGLNVPVTVKIRILQNDPTGYKTMALGRALQNCGASIVTLHGRTRDNTKENIGYCNFDMIRRLKEELRIPVFANGGIENIHDIQEAAYVTKADAVMVSEALLTWPAIFAYDNPADMPDPINLALEFMEINKQYPGWEGCIRPHLFKLLFRELSIHTGVRYLLGAPKIAGDINAVMYAVRQEQFAMYKLHQSDREKYSAKTFITYADIFAEGKKHVVTPSESKKIAQNEKNTQNAQNEEAKVTSCYDEENKLEIASNISVEDKSGEGKKLPTLPSDVFEAISKVLSSPQSYTLPTYTSKKERALAQPYEFKASSDDDATEDMKITKDNFDSYIIDATMRQFLEEIYASRVHWYNRYFSHNVKNTGSKLATLKQAENSLENDKENGQISATTSDETECIQQGDAKRHKKSDDNIEKDIIVVLQ